jgi:hypothetical protein
MPYRLHRGFVGVGGIIVGAAVDLPNAGCIVWTIALWPARGDLLDGDALLRKKRSRRMFGLVCVEATAVQAPFFKWSRLSLSERFAL